MAYCATATVNPDPPNFSPIRKAAPATKPQFCLFLQKQNNMEIVAAPIVFTPSALAEIKRLMDAEGFDDTQYLRIGVKGGGCSGMTYILEFDTKDEQQDDFFELDGVGCIMNKAHGIYLLGMEVDWQGGLNSRGFTFKNPNAATTCGCGTSFGV
jgi:iron-sulfur cluster assembly accessory protein